MTTTEGAQLVVPSTLGHVHYLTPDMVDTLPSEHSATLAIGDLVGTIESVKKREGVRDFFGISKRTRTLFLAQNGPYDRVRCSRSRRRKKRGSDELTPVTVLTSHGKADLTPETFVEMIDAVRADVAIVPHQEPILTDTKAETLIAVDERCEVWTERCLDLVSASNTKTRLLAPIFPRSRRAVASFVKESSFPTRDRYAAFLPSYVFRADGFEICGLGGQETDLDFGLMAQETIRRVRTARGRSSDASFKTMLRRVTTPQRVAIAVAAGVDWIETVFPLEATRNGDVLNCRVETTKDEHGTNAIFRTNAEDGTCPRVAVDRIHLWDKKHVVDTGPLLESCACFACKNHTRAYVHHLLHTHEILGSVLLHLHNLHNAFRFVSALNDLKRRDRLALAPRPTSSKNDATKSSTARSYLPAPVSSARKETRVGVAYQATDIPKCHGGGKDAGA